MTLNVQTKSDVTKEGNCGVLIYRNDTVGWKIFYELQYKRFTLWFWDFYKRQSFFSAQNYYNRRMWLLGFWTICIQIILGITHSNWKGGIFLQYGKLLAIVSLVLGAGLREISEEDSSFESFKASCELGSFMKTFYISCSAYFRRDIKHYQDSQGFHCVFGPSKWTNLVLIINTSALYFR